MHSGISTTGLWVSVAFTALVTTNFACGSSSDPKPSGEDALSRDDPTSDGRRNQFRISSVDVSTAASAVQEVGATFNYLPYGYEEDGCYARALYVAMELAVHQIPSNALFAFATPGRPLQVRGMSWRYHVAPLLWVRGWQPNEPETTMVFDPGVSPGRPLTIDGWLHAIGRQHGEPGGPVLVSVPGSKYGIGGIETYYDALYDVPSFAAMPAFNESDVLDACSVMYRYLNADTPYVGSNQAKQSMLLGRTRTLLDGLVAVGKLNHNAQFTEAACGAVGARFTTASAYGLDPSAPPIDSAP